MRILVTGANGHIGSNLVRNLVERKHDVVGLVREGSNHEGLEGVAVKKMLGDVRDSQAVLDAAKGCDVIIHLAAVYAWASTIEKIVQPAMEGIENIFAAAKEVGVSRIVHTSSIVAVGMSDSPLVRGPKDWTENSREPYIIAKTKSERLAWDKADKMNIPLVVINPSGILGRHDYKITPSNQFLIDYAHGQGARFEGGINYVDVRDVAHIHAEAVDRGEPGQRYIVGGPNLSVEEFAKAVCQRCGSKAIPYAFPRWMMIPMAGIIEKLQGPNGPVKKGLAEEFYRRWCWYDTSSTQDAFDWQPRGIDEMLDDSLSWLVHRKVLKPKSIEKVRANIKVREFEALS